MEKSREHSEKDIYEDIGAKNNERLLLLVSIKSFQKEVEKIRQAFHIIPEENQVPYHLQAHLWYEKNNQEKFNPLFRLPGSTTFKNAVTKLCKRYRVPENFYNVYLRCVPLYIVSGIISAPTENWERINPKKGRGNFAFQFYSPLSQAELKEFGSILKSDFETGIKGKNQVITTKREHRQFMRDWELVMPLINRQGKPKKIKQYEQGSYLGMVNKNPAMTKKKLRELEKLHSSSVIVAYDYVTTSSLARKKRMSPAALRQAKKRLNGYAKDLYGFSLEE